MPTFRILQGHWLDQAKHLADNSIHIAVCSPPYWALRDYKTPPQLWGGDSNCEHEWGENIIERTRRHGATRALHATRETDKAAAITSREHDQGSFCTHCKAWRGELGQEPTPALFVAHMVEVFREVKRVLRPDGTLWINIGDSYATGAGSARRPGGKTYGKANPVVEAGNYLYNQPNRLKIEGLKTGDLVGIPWALATALRADGWYLRRDNIWRKEACMPESVMGWRWERCRQRIKPSARSSAESAHSKAQIGVAPPQGARNGRDFHDHGDEFADCPGCRKCERNDGLVLRKGSGRCTTSHEYIFHFSKEENYYYDSDAIAEPIAGASLTRINQSTFDSQNGGPKDYGTTGVNPDRSMRKTLENFARNNNGTRNKRSVWTLAPEPYSEDHFAAYPSELPMICIKAGTSEHGCCADCGAPYARVVRRKAMVIERSGRNEKTGMRTGSSGTMVEPAESETLGWRRTCNCATATMVPPIVLDPFGGRGTTGAAAVRLGRDVILCELQTDYLPMIRKNIRAEASLFVEEIE